jgi:uncharacterized NAD(P)/FAD-binding protein YdhS
MSEGVIRIAIVGGGLTGALLCMQLLRSRSGPFSIHLYEKAPQRFCRGVAYSSTLPYQLLNVPAGKMSLFGDQPDDFLAWLATYGELHAASSYVVRHRFGDYVSARFDQSVMENRHHRFTRIVDEVLDITPASDGLRVEAAQTGARGFDRIYLCTGNFPPADPPGLDSRLRAAGRYIAAPWDGSYLERVGSDDTVLVIGTGLSMIDQLMSLQEHPGFNGNVIALSRRGLLPLAHGETAPYTLEQNVPDTTSVKRLYAWLRTEVRNAERMDSGFQAVIDALRPKIPEIWNGLSENERKRFMRHLRPFWEIHRHRIPGPTATRLQELLSAGKLRVIAGRVSAVTQMEFASIQVDYQPRTRRTQQQLTVDWVINCTGPQADYRQLRSPLYRSLLERGLLHADASGLGITTTLSGQALRNDGRIEPRLTLVGPPAKASLWESTALQEIRQQVQRIVEELAVETLQRRA